MAVLVLDTIVLASYVLGDSSMRQESNRLLRIPYEFIAPGPMAGGTGKRFLEKRTIRSLDI